MLISDLFLAFRKGQEVANPATWKNAQIAVNSVSALLAAVLAVAKGFGLDLAITEAQIDALAAGIVAAVGVFNAVATVVSSRKVGLPPVSGASGEPQPDGQ